MLSLVGLYGTMTFSAAQRTREVGIRLACGAQPREIVALFLRSMRRPILTGIGLGLPLAVLASTLLARANVQADVQPADLWPYAVALSLLVSTACLATLIPAAAVARIESSHALRHE